jgi:SM-20-related protein
MAAEADMAAEIANRPSDQLLVRCPHLVWRNVLGMETVAALLDYVGAREKDFSPGVLRNRESGKLKIDYSLRNCVYFMDLGAFEPLIKSFVRRVTAQALDALRLPEPAVAAREFELTAYRDGGYFGSHIDTDERLHRVRVLSCVYYFAATPRRFSGGTLRIYGFPTLSAATDGGSPAFVDVLPETDTLVAFPSWLRHQVLPVRVPSGAWKDGRFTINCWIHRVSSSAAETSAGP